MKRAEEEANRIRRNAGQLVHPVDVDAIAQHLGVPVVREPFQSDLAEISGVLYQKDGRAVIGVNAAHAPTRQRFTVAHEIGHFVLHKGASALHVDRSISLRFRDARASQAVDADEIAANAFAAELLMPRELLTTELLAKWVRRAETESDFIDGLAKEFTVSHQAMTHRLVNLGILTPQ